IVRAQQRLEAGDLHREPFGARDGRGFGENCLQERSKPSRRGVIEAKEANLGNEAFVLGIEIAQKALRERERFALAAQDEAVAAAISRNVERIGKAFAGFTGGLGGTKRATRETLTLRQGFAARFGDGAGFGAFEVY